MGHVWLPDAEQGLKLGGGIALSNTTVAANGGNSTIQQGSLFVYGKMPLLQDYVLDGMVRVGLRSTNLSRNDPTGYRCGFSSKTVMGNDPLVSVGLSRAFDYGDVRITPYARLSYQYVGQKYTYRPNLAMGADISGLLNPTLDTTLGSYSNRVTSATAGSAFVQVGLYDMVKIAENAYAYAGVSGEARSGQTLYGDGVKLRLVF